MTRRRKSSRRAKHEPVTERPKQAETDEARTSGRTRAKVGRVAAVTSILIVLGGAAAWWLGGRDLVPEQPAPASFVGSELCSTCHSPEHADWVQSQHALAMQEATNDSVLGSFADDPALAGDAAAPRFARRDGRFFVTTDGPDGELAEFEVTHTFGVYPLQQYLVPLAGGRLQALGFAWDSRDAAAGGQRWFDLYEGENLAAGDPLHWTGIDQNWNYQCADCHSTNVRKSYDASTRSFDTSWSEISVGCEACHGPASNHVAWATKAAGWRSLETTRGLAVALDERRAIDWLPQDTGTARRSVPRATAREIDTCARCHSRREQFTDAVHAGDDWLDAFHPALLEPGLYYPDGQQRAEVYTWGSFVQSRMHAAGVTCADCHEPHSQRLRAPGNAVCAQCHTPTVFDTAAHHHHEPGTAGAACTACHMPTTTYMAVDPRHDHSLRIPRPDLSVTHGTPNACSACHSDEEPQWAAAAVERWYPERKPGFQSFAETFAAADRGDPAAASGLGALISDAQQPALVRASAIARGARLPAPELLVTVMRALTDSDALVRTAAVEAVAGADPTVRADRLTRLLTDPARLVRMAAARALAGAPEARLAAEVRPRFAAALAEWTAGQEFNADRPEAQLNLGALQAERGAADAAAAHYREALALDPRFAPAAVNLADTLSASGDEVGAADLLRTALARDPNAAAVHHALGLSLVREGRRDEAVAALGRAHDLAPGDSRFAFVYAVALHDTGQRAAAIELLTRASRQHPFDPNLRQALADYEAEVR
jgi:tetratricopeptide (TPR) repeat protein